MPDDARAVKTLRGKTQWWRSRFAFVMRAWLLCMLRVRSVMERRAIFLSRSPGARLSRTPARASGAGWYHSVIYSSVETVPGIKKPVLR